MADKSIMSYETVALDDEKSALVILDQTKLPYEVEILSLTDQKDIWNAIYLLQVRGAPAIGVAAGFGVYLAAKQIQADNWEDFYTQFKAAKDYLNSSRPTAVNLSWALNRMEKVVTDNKDKSIPEIKELLHKECVAIKDEDVWMCRQIGEYGLTLIKDGDGILTHCNAGAIATGGYGTALGVVRSAFTQGKVEMVYCDETRPLLQGARLTAWELVKDGIPATLITDNMAASLMAQGKIDLVLLGCDRMAANGDFANKIGTYGVAVLAHYHGIPFYSVLPSSTIDLSIPDGSHIPIEQREASEVTHFAGVRTAPEGVGVYNPAFDVTPHRLLTGIITEKGVIHPPFAEQLAERFG